MANFTSSIQKLIYAKNYFMNSIDNQIYRGELKKIFLITLRATIKKSERYLKMTKLKVKNSKIFKHGLFAFKSYF